MVLEGVNIPFLFLFFIVSFVHPGIVVEMVGLIVSPCPICLLAPLFTLASLHPYDNFFKTNDILFVPFRFGPKHPCSMLSKLVLLTLSNAASLPSYCFPAWGRQMNVRA